jgi:hypothetical protein
MIGYVYFAVSKDEKLVKIGHSIRPRARIKELKSPGLRLAGIVEGSIHHEKQFHHRFRSLNSYGEWFENSGELKKFLRSLPSPPQDKPGITGVINIRQVPGQLIRRIRIAAADEGKSLPVFLIDYLDRNLRRP